MIEATQVVIERVHTIDYRMPLKRPYGTARGVTRASTNFLLRLHGSVSGRTMIAVGEAQPRRNLSGDVDTDTAWSFFNLAAESLSGRSLDCSSPGQGLASVEKVMRDLEDLARTHSQPANAAKPFRGCLLGLEVALLDLVARAVDVPVSGLLGEKRDQVEVTVRTLSNQNTPEEIRKKVMQQAHIYPMVRVKGVGDIGADIDLLRRVHEANVEANVRKPVWMDLNEGFTPRRAAAFVELVADDIRDGRLPEVVTLEQPVPHSKRGELPILQKLADEATADIGAGDIRIMADESLWDIDDLEWLHERGGCRAINIKTAKAGGLLASLKLAHRAVELDPNIHICIGGMVGTSDITTWSLINLGKALPRLDYITAVPPGGPVKRISSPLTEFEKKSSVHVKGEGAGLGSRLAYETIIPFIKRYSWSPALPESADQAAANAYDTVHLRDFEKIQLDNHLLEREAHALGLNTLRTNRIGFVASDTSSSSIAFWWTKSTASARPATGITSDKHSTRILLDRAGVPVPKGERFGPRELDRAAEYAHALGFPVVLKPLRGTGGRGVVTDIRDEEQLRRAASALKGTGYEDGDIIVEEQIQGTSGRIFVVGDEVLSMIQWPDGAVTGDGYRTVGELLLLKHQLRMRNPHLMNRAIKFDDSTRYQLERQGVEYDTVLAPGQRVVFSANPNPQQGGETRDAVDILHPSFVEASVRAVKVIPGLAFSGVDWIIPDIQKPLSEQRAAICELNAHPSQSGNEFPLYGQPARVSRAIVKLAAERRGLVVAQAPAATLTVRLIIEGRRINEEYVDWFGSRARKFGLSGWVQRDGRNSAHALLSGASERVSALASLAFVGAGGARVHSVETVHVSETGPDSFEVRS